MSGLEGDAVDFAAAAILNARASMERINDLLAPAAPVSNSTVATPPPGLTADEELKWWNDKIATLSSDSDQKTGLVCAPGSSGAAGAKGASSSSAKAAAAGGGAKDAMRMAPRGMNATEEAGWMDQRMARLAESKGAGSKEYK